MELVVSKSSGISDFFDLMHRFGQEGIDKFTGLVRVLNTALQVCLLPTGIEWLQLWAINLSLYISSEKHPIIYLISGKNS